MHCGCVCRPLFHKGLCCLSIAIRDTAPAAALQRDCCYVVEASGLRGLRSQDLQQMEDTTSTVTLTAPAAQHRVAQQPTQVGSTGPTESAQTPPAAAAAATAVAATPHSRLPVLSAANVTSPALGTAISASSRAGCGAQMHGGVVQRVQQLV